MNYLPVADYIESGIVPAAVQMLDEDSADEFRAEGILVCSLMLYGRWQPGTQFSKNLNIILTFS